MNKIGCFVILVAIIGIPVVASQFLPWWGTLLVIVGLVGGMVVGIPWVLKRGFTSFAEGMFSEKSKVLRDATLEVHSVGLTEKPLHESYDDDEEFGEEDDYDDEDEEDDYDDEEAARYVLVDCTITPKPQDGNFQHWDPSELLLVPVEKDTSFAAAESDDDDSPEAFVADVKHADDEVEKLNGPVRLSITFGCPESLTGEVKMQYYFEGFGRITLP